MHQRQLSIRRPVGVAGLVILVAGLAVAGCALGPNTQSPSSSTGVGGPGIGGATTTSPQTVQNQVDALAGTIQVDTATNQIRYTTPQVTLVVVGSPPGRDGEYWQVDGRMNPRVIVPAGAHMTVEVVNGDPDMPHGWVLTTAGPPYGQMPMMRGMYGGMASYAAVAPLPETQDNQWPMTTITFTAPRAGTYYYICQVPDHAQEGMWGTLVVQ